MALKDCTNGCGQKLAVDVGRCTSCGGMQDGFRPMTQADLPFGTLLNWIMFFIVMIFISGCILVMGM